MAETNDPFFWGNEPPEEADYFTDNSSFEEPGDLVAENPSDEITLSQFVYDQLVLVVAGVNGRSPQEVLTLVDSIKNEATVWKELAAESVDVWTGALEVVGHTANNTRDLRVNLGFTPVESTQADEVVALMERIRLHKDEDNGDYAVRWSALLTALQHNLATKSAEMYLQLLVTKATDQDLMEAYERLAPAVRSGLGARDVKDMSATALAEEYERATAGVSQIRFNFGLPSLDKALTPAGCPLGAIGPGEQVLIAGDTGTGKTSFTYSTIVPVAIDMINWGFPDGSVMLCHTEEEAIDKIKGMRVAPGQRFGHLGKNIKVYNLGSSRKSLVEAIYNEVILAVRKANSTGRPVSDFLPRVLFLDYIQALSDPGESDVTYSSMITAELVLRGLQAFNHREMAKFSGVSFEDYAGMAWPEGLEQHRLAVVVMAQLVKIDAKGNSYDPTSKQSLLDFTLEYEEGDPVSEPWTAPNGTRYCWEVKPGDARLLGRNEVRGHGQVLQNATTLLFLHRSRPVTNPAYEEEATGETHIQDLRARIQLAKTRNGASVKFVPLLFDVQPDGPKAQYFDPNGMKAVQAGHLNVDPIFTSWGDPMVPVRPGRDPFDGVSY